MGFRRYRSSRPAPKNLRPNQMAVFLKRQFSAPVRQDASGFIHEVARLLLPDGLPFNTQNYDDLRPLIIRASWLAAGLAVAATQEHVPIMSRRVLWSLN